MSFTFQWMVLKDCVTIAFGRAIITGLVIIAQNASKVGWVLKKQYRKRACVTYEESVIRIWQAEGHRCFWKSGRSGKASEILQLLLSEVLCGLWGGCYHLTTMSTILWNLSVICRIVLICCCALNVVTSKLGRRNGVSYVRHLGLVLFLGCQTRMYFALEDVVRLFLSSSFHVHPPRDDEEFGDP